MTTTTPRPIQQHPWAVRRSVKGGSPLRLLHTTDPKDIAILYLVTTFAMFMIEQHDTGSEWPPTIAPMLATARPLPASGAGYGWEFKWDGARAIARIRADGQVRLDSRNANDLTLRPPRSPPRSAKRWPGGG